MKNKDKIKVAILATDFIKWGGGIDFIRLCLFGLFSSHNQKKYDVVILSPNKAKIKRVFIRNLVIVKGIIKQILNGQKPIIRNISQINYDLIEEAFKQIHPDLEIHHFPNTRNGLIKKLKELHVDLVLPSIQNLNKGFPVPWIGYLFDFQHKYYPEFFPQKALKARDRNFELMLSNATSVIVNANSVKQDIDHYIPQSKSKIFCLPFAPITFNEHLESNADCEINFKMPEKYFIICNQFWIHKDHKTAFKAFKLLIESINNLNIFLICTGKTHDERFPDLFLNLKHYLREESIYNNVIFTGYLPKVTQIKLLRNSIALIQPTLFEGGPGGFAVYEALAYGTRVIVSDISVNKEIKNYDVVFFQAKNAVDLANKMHEVILNPQEPIENSFLRAKTDENIQALGELLNNAITYTLEKYR